MKRYKTGVGDQVALTEGQRKVVHPLPQIARTLPRYDSTLVLESLELAAREISAGTLLGRCRSLSPRIEKMAVRPILGIAFRCHGHFLNSFLHFSPVDGSAGSGTLAPWGDIHCTLATASSGQKGTTLIL